VTGGELKIWAEQNNLEPVTIAAMLYVSPTTIYNWFKTPKAQIAKKYLPRLEQLGCSIARAEATKLNLFLSLPLVANN
jgi:hypothetical protein